MKIKHRFSTASDLPEIVEIDKAAFEPSWSSKDFLAFSAPGENIIIVATLADEIAGYCAYSLAPGSIRIDDVYCVLDAFNVTCPARQHAIKKLLCAGIRGKGNATQDLTEAADAVRRAIELEKQRSK